MKPSEALSRHRQTVREIVAANRAANPRVFGSVARGSDADGSDLDLLVDPTEETSLLDIARIQSRLQTLLGVAVDVVTPNGLPDRVRRQVLAAARPI